MSDDNWVICPKCKANKNKEWNEIEQGLKAAYTKDEYLSWQQKKDSFVELEWTLREDYEIGIFDGNDEFYVSYMGRCSVCGFEKRFKHTEKLEVF